MEVTFESLTRNDYAFHYPKTMTNTETNNNNNKVNGIILPDEV